MAAAAQAGATPSRLILVGDLHGQLAKTQQARRRCSAAQPRKRADRAHAAQLWQRLEAFCGADHWPTAKVIFLGDYVDRGPDTCGVLEFLSSLRVRHPRQTHVFLAGNHDLAMAAFCGQLQGVAAAGADAAAAGYETWRPNEGALYAAPDASGMHLQGRRWAVDVSWRQRSIFNSEAAFASYGVGYAQRAELLAAMPEAHKAFLRDMDWCHTCELPPGAQGAPLEGGGTEPAASLIAVHAGLVHYEDVDAQVAMLTRRDANRSFVEQLSNRRDVLDPPPVLAARQTVLVSGHHRKLIMQPWRLVIDTCGGEHTKPITAVVLPGRACVRSD